MHVRSVLQFFRRKPKRHWVITVVLIVVGMVGGSFLDDSRLLIDLRYFLYRGFARLAPRQAIPKWTVLILVDDQEYWKGDLARRVPIRRDYLAHLVHNLDLCDPEAIALDFDLRSPATDGSLKENPQYSGETRELISEVLQVSMRRPVILPATIESYPGDLYTVDSAVYDGIRLEKGKIQVGYIQPPDDAREVPVAVKLRQGGKIDSFAEAIVRARHERVLARVGTDDSLPLGTFMPEKRFRKITAFEVLHGPSKQACEAIQHNIVIAGASWHQHSFNEGELADLHATPLGPLRGVFLHANYVEALLDSRTFVPLEENISRLIELIFTSVIALLLAAKVSAWRKAGAVAGCCLLCILVSYVAWQNLGIFFDFFFPVLLLLIHAFIEYFRELRKERHKAR
jgi:CHASE2 domain-containing sensor protein